MQSLVSRVWGLGLVRDTEIFHMGNVLGLGEYTIYGFWSSYIGIVFPYFLQASSK